MSNDDGFTNKELLQMIYKNQLETNRHLEELNGKVIRNIKDIEENRKLATAVKEKTDDRLDKLEKRFAYYAGAAAVLLFVLDVLLRFFL